MKRKDKEGQCGGWGWEGMIGFDSEERSDLLYVTIGGIIIKIIKAQILTVLARGELFLYPFNYGGCYG